MKKAEDGGSKITLPGYTQSFLAYFSQTLLASEFQGKVSIYRNRIEQSRVSFENGIKYQFLDDTRIDSDANFFSAPTRRQQ